MCAQYVAGIDEAGKGPIIGPLVLAIAAIEKNKEDHLRGLGVKDSKLLTPQQRGSLVGHIKGWTSWNLVVVEPLEIDEAVLSDSLNLNWLEAIHSAKLIDAMATQLVKEHQELLRVVVDCPSNNISAYTSYLKTHLKHKEIEIIAEHKADLNHPIVSAASIIAKTTRDARIEDLKKKFGVNFGSGYPSDPTTKVFVENHFKDPRLVTIMRKSWETYQKLVRKSKQKGLGEF
jgi:ribonuclease HII